MADISIDDVKKLRDETGISVMQCKKALEEAGGDEEKARVILQKISKQQAEKKAERELGAGVVQAYVHGEGSVGAMVLLSSETDFVAKNEEFRQLAYDIAMHVAAMNPTYIRKEDISEEDREKAKEAFQQEVEDKPEDKQEMILEGKLDAYFKEQVLMEQAYIKDPDVTIGNMIENAVQKFGENVDVTDIKRLSTS